MGEGLEKGTSLSSALARADTLGWAAPAPCVMALCFFPFSWVGVSTICFHKGSWLPLTNTPPPTDVVGAGAVLPPWRPRARMSLIKLVSTLRPPPPPGGDLDVEWRVLTFAQGQC